jgi:hypothetical protein
MRKDAMTTAVAIDPRQKKKNVVVHDVSLTRTR